MTSALLFLIAACVGDYASKMAEVYCDQSVECAYAPEDFDTCFDRWDGLITSSQDGCEAACVADQAKKSECLAQVAALECPEGGSNECPSVCTEVYECSGEVSGNCLKGLCPL